MALEVRKDYYEEIETSPVAHFTVKEAGKFIEAMLNFFRNNGTLYISSYDFGYWAEKLALFRSGERVKLITSLPDPAFLENGYALSDEFVYVFRIECLKNVDPRTMFNQFLIYQGGRPALQACNNFDDVYLNVKVPQRILDKLVAENVMAPAEDAGA